MKRGPYQGSFLWELSQKNIDDVVTAINSSISIHEVCTKLNLSLSGSSYPAFRVFVDENKIDTSHFVGKGWKKGLDGRKALDSKSGKRLGGTRRKSPEDLFKIYEKRSVHKD